MDKVNDMVARLLGLTASTWLLMATGVSMVGAAVGLMYKENFFGFKDWTHKVLRVPIEEKARRVLADDRVQSAPAGGQPSTHRPPLPTDEFAIELLSEPVILTRAEDGTLRVSISRNNIRGHIYTTKDKRDICQKAFSSRERLNAGHRLDGEIHEFLLGRSQKPGLKVNLDNLPLRWASGGVLSVVRWRGAHWTPFFFRDIPPYGWNIALGSSEEGDDLNDPWTFLWREFLEETLVLADEPQPGKPIDFKPFVVERLDIAHERQRAAKFAAEHIEARHHADGLLIQAGGLGQIQQDPSPILDPRVCVAADFGKTRTEILITEGSSSRVHRNVLVAISPLELGIEVVKVLEYDLEPSDFILDGEMLRSEQGKHLVRMPVALISHAYLSRTFRALNLESSPSIDIQPSIVAPAIQADELHLYSFDALRRRDIAMRLDPGASPWELERYGLWMERYGMLFFDAEGPRSAHQRALFTPAAAKILSYYFAGC